MGFQNVKVLLLADHPEFMRGWAELHWKEWGDEPGREKLEWWVQAAAKAVQTSTVPVAFVAMNGNDEVIGGVGLDPFDPEEYHDRSPWIVGMIVRQDVRNNGIGHLLLQHVDQWLLQTKIPQVWVATGGQAIAFYQQCGYRIVEDRVPPAFGTILMKIFVS